MEAGNPKYYSTFLDEALNSLVAIAASKSEGYNWEIRTLVRMQMRALLDEALAGWLKSQGCCRRASQQSRQCITIVYT